MLAHVITNYVSVTNDNLYYINIPGGQPKKCSDVMSKVV